MSGYLNLKNKSDYWKLETNLPYLILIDWEWLQIE